MGLHEEFWLWTIFLGIVLIIIAIVLWYVTGKLRWWFWIILGLGVLALVIGVVWMGIDYRNKARLSQPAVEMTFLTEPKLPVLTVSASKPPSTSVPPIQSATSLPSSQSAFPAPLSRSTYPTRISVVPSQAQTVSMAGPGNRLIPVTIVNS